MKVMPSRRNHRRVYRKLRFYLPLVAVLLLAMLIFLPLSAPWMARRFEREVLMRTGIAVKLERLEVQLARGTIEAFGLEVPGIDDEETFRLEYLSIQGPLTSLLAGGDRYPETIRLAAPPQVRLVRDEEGRYELAGPFQTLLRALDPILTANRNQSNGSSEDEPRTPRGMGRTPELVLEDLRAFVESPDASLPPVELTLTRVRLSPRTTKQSPLQVAIVGFATANVTERFTLYARTDPALERIEVTGRLEGLFVPFGVPTIGLFDGYARGVAVDATLRRGKDGQADGALAISADRFQLARRGLGGERWNDRDLEGLLRFTFGQNDNQLVLHEFSIQGEQIDIAARGDVILRDGLPGSAAIVINDLPAGLVALGRNQLLDHLQVSVEPTQASATLRLEATARGEFANPVELDTEAFTLLRGWRVRLPQLPEPITINELNVQASPQEAVIRKLDLDYGEVTLGLRGTVPLQSGEAGQLSVELRGEAGSAVMLLDSLGVDVPEVTAVRLPVRLRGDFPFVLAIDGTPRITTETLTLSAEWGAGEVSLNRLPDPIRLEAGSIRLSGEALRVQRLRLESRGLTIAMNATLNEPWSALAGEAPRVDASVFAAGRVEDALFVAQRIARTPALPADLAGGFQLDLQASTLQGLLEEAQYRVRFQFDEGTVTVPTPHRLVPIRGLGFDLTASNDQVELRRGRLTIADPVIGDSTVDFGVSATDSELRADATVRSKFEYLTALLARDLSDLVMEGSLPATAWATARPREALPEGPDLVRRWIAYMQKPELVISHRDEADLKLDFEVRYTQESPITIFAREFPVPVTNVRGGATFTPASGIVFNAMQGDFGSARDVRFSGSVVIGKPTVIRFELDADHLDINEWMDGWGTRPWSSSPISYVPRWQAVPTPVQFVQVEGRISARSIQFMQFRGGPARTELELKAWSRIPLEMWLRNMEVEAYGGVGRSESLDFIFPRGQRPILTTSAHIEDIELKGFMDALYERPQAMDGLLTADMSFHGQLLNYPTYEGNATFVVNQTGVVGNVFLTYWRELLQTGSVTGGRDGNIRGRVEMSDQRVHFIDLRIFSPAVNMTADGYVDFRGRLNYDITASVISKRLRDIPVISIVGDVWDMIGRQIISYRLEGTLRSPRYYAIPTVVTRLQAMRDFVRQTTLPGTSGSAQGHNQPGASTP